jgi:hypothetical protein
MNSATRSLSSTATKTGISSTRSCTAVIFGFIPQAYIKSQNRDLIHANIEYEDPAQGLEAQGQQLHGNFNAW